MDAFKTLRDKLYRIRTYREPWRLIWLPLAALLLLFKKRPRKTAYRNVLLINFGGLGDVLMMTPALRSIKEHFPDAKVDLMVGKSYVQKAFEGHPDLDDVICIKMARMSAFLKPLGSIGAIWNTLYLYPREFVKSCLRRYGIGINYGVMFHHWDRFGNAFMYSLGIPMRLGFDKNESWLLTDKVQKRRELEGKELYLAFLEPLNIEAGSKDLFSPPGDVKGNPLVNKIIKEKAKAWATIHPGGTSHINTRRWPVEHFAEVGKYLLSRGTGIVVTGDHEDQGVCDELAKRLGDEVVNSCDKLDFKETAFLLSCSKICVTNDTSIVHLADAVKVPHILAIFGPTDPTYLVSGNDRYHIFKSDLECAPCRVGAPHEEVVPCDREIKQECLKFINPQLIIEKLKALPIFEKNTS